MGNIVEKTNFYYPCDDSLIYQKRQIMGDLEKKYCGAVNASYTLAMGPNVVLADMVDNAMKLLVEYKDDYGFALNVTQETGLVLKFLDNGDVMQTI